jgi:MOSC domain-containing protein YiiM
MELVVRIASVNVGVKTPIKVGHREAQSGIFKRPVDHQVEVKRLGITGDVVIDKKHHGGPDQAVYVYRSEDYEFWSTKLGRELPPGMFGENLTVSGLPSPALLIGERLRFDTVEFEITAPRIPCNVFAARMGDTGFIKTFMQEARPGFYVRVTKEGILAIGDQFELVPPDFESLTTVQMFRDVKSKLDAATLERYLSLPIDTRTRADFSARLAKNEA